MKIFAIPEGVMMFETKMNPDVDAIHLRAYEIGELLRWLNTTRHGFIEDELQKVND
jgi:hypothetical protein